MTDDLMKKAIEWIDNPERDYDTGVLLYNKLGKNRNIKKVLERKNADKGMHILLYNLEKTVGHKQAVKESKKDKPSGDTENAIVGAANNLINKGKELIGRLRVKKNPTINYDDLPDDLKKLFDENGKLESEKKTVHAKMTALSAAPENNAKRKEYSNRLIQIEASQAANWKVIDDWWNNKDKDPEKTIELSPAEKAVKAEREKQQRIENLKSQASRRTAKLKDPQTTDADKTKAQTELDGIVKELKELGSDYNPRK